MAHPLRDRALSRRTFLRGAGTLVALPMLDAMLPIRARARAAVLDSRKRLCLVFLPNGANMAEWTPSETGRRWIATPTLEPLERVRAHVQVFSGFGIDGAAAHGDGPGDHARAAAAFLTHTHPSKTAGPPLRAGISVDQIAAPLLSRSCDFPSLVLGCENGRRAGSCDSGYSCSYSNHISWASPEEPCSKETSPRRLFARLFGDPDQARDRRARQEREERNRSVLDFVLEDAHRLSRNLDAQDRGRLERYSDGVRELERRLEQLSTGRREEIALPDDIPAERPSSYQEHLALMYDMIALAFETDRTRVATLMVGNAGSNRSYPWLGVPEGHHELSHHDGDLTKRGKIQAIDRFQVDHFARFVERLSTLQEAGSNVLEQSLVVCGSAIGDGNRHNHDDLPILLAGHGGGAVEGGAHVRTRKGTPLANLFLSILNRLDVPVPRFADSNGQVREV